MKWRVSETLEVLVNYFGGISMDMRENVLRVLKEYTGEWYWEKKCRRKKIAEFCDERELCVANIWFKKTGKRKITYSAGGCETELDIVLVGEKYKKYIRDVKVIPWELYHKLVVVDLDKKVVRKQRIIRRKIWKLNENRTRVKFIKRVKELVNTDAPDVRKTFKNGVLKACDEVCGKKKSRRDRGDMWSWNEEVGQGYQSKKEGGI